MKEELKNKSLKQIIIMVIAIISVLLVGILVGTGIANSKDSNSNNDEITDDKDDELVQDDEENKEEDIILEEYSILDEDTKNKLYYEVQNYVLTLNLFNKEYSCKNNIMTKDCIDDVTKMKLILYVMRENNEFSEKVYDEENLTNTYYATATAIRKYEKEIFGTNEIELPSGEEISNSNCPSYEKTNDGYKITEYGPSCSFGAHSTKVNNQWHSNNIDYMYKEKDYVFVDILYYYTYGNDLYNFDETTRYCTSNTKEECSESFEQLDESKLKKARFIFEYKDNKLSFQAIKILNDK